jgi:hypothetical protein
LYKDVHGKRDVYMVTLAHKGQNMIGINSTYSGYVAVADDDNFTMVQSAWCQRTTSWSKNIADVVDQRYNHWGIVEWFTGPFAERRQIHLDEAPLVFSGNKHLDRAAKMQAIKDHFAGAQAQLKQLRKL